MEAVHEHTYKFAPTVFRQFNQGFIAPGPLDGDGLELWYGKYDDEFQHYVKLKDLMTIEQKLLSRQFFRSVDSQTQARLVDGGIVVLQKKPSSRRIRSVSRFSAEEYETMKMFAKGSFFFMGASHYP